jgi:enoyl-CoA hydratase
MIERADAEGIAVVRLAHGKVNALDIELLEAISATFDEIGRSEARAAVLTGTGSAFSAGVDLRRLTSGGPDYIGCFLDRLDEAFEAVFRTPQPVVAAVSGHAIAGGCVFACACDWRVMADGRGRVGVPELAVGVPFPTVPYEIMRFAVGSAALPALFAAADTYPPAEACQRGLIDEVVPAESLIDRAIAVAKELSGDRIPAATFRLTKQQLRRDTIAAIEHNRPLDHAAVVARWTDPATLEWIDAYLARVTGGR